MPAKQHAALDALLHKDGVIEPIFLPLVVRILKVQSAGIAREIDRHIEILRHRTEFILEVLAFRPDFLRHLTGFEFLHDGNAGRQREALSAEGRRDEYVSIHLFHDILAPRHDRKRHAVRRCLAKG